MVYFKNQGIRGRKPKHKCFCETGKTKNPNVETTTVTTPDESEKLLRLKAEMTSSSSNEENSLRAAKPSAASLAGNGQKNRHNFFSSRLFKCYECNATFTRSFHFRKHLDAHENKGPFICSKCRSAFPLRSSLTSHMEDHDRKRSFDCKICGHVFKSLYFLKKHHKSHDVGHFVCDSCGTSFREKSVLKKHVQECVKIADEPDAKRANCDAPRRQQDNLNGNRSVGKLPSISRSVTVPIGSSRDTLKVSLKPCSVVLSRLSGSFVFQGTQKRRVSRGSTPRIKPCYVKLDTNVRIVLKGRKKDCAAIPSSSSSSTSLSIPTTHSTNPSSPSPPELPPIEEDDTTMNHIDNAPESVSPNDSLDFSNQIPSPEIISIVYPEPGPESSPTHSHVSVNDTYFDKSFEVSPSKDSNSSKEGDLSVDVSPWKSFVDSSKEDEIDNDAPSKTSLDLPLHLIDQEPFIHSTDNEEDMVLKESCSKTPEKLENGWSISVQDENGLVGSVVGQEEEMLDNSNLTETNRASSNLDLPSTSTSIDLPSTSTSIVPYLQINQQQALASSETPQRLPPHLPSHPNQQQQQQQQEFPEQQQEEPPSATTSSENKRALLLAWLQWTDLQKQQLPNQYF